MRFAVVAVIAALVAAPSFAQEPSVKEDLEDAGHSVKQGVQGGYEKSKDAAVTTYDKAKNATEHGVGTALEKTGEGLDKAGRKIEGAGEDVKDKVE